MTENTERNSPTKRYRIKRATSTLYFWKNGFSVDDGPLYSYDDPQNHDMLLSISRGRAPTSLFNVRYEQPIDIRAVGRLNRNYDPPEPVGNPSNYYGGIRLGDSRSPAQQSPSNSEDLREPKTIEVNESEPVVTVKIQLYQGTRLVWSC